MKWKSILDALYTILAILGCVLLVLGAEAEDVIDTIVGMGAVILGVLGLAAISIDNSIRESREVKQS